jgi:nucleoside-diphosphate-sugar epimerase
MNRIAILGANGFVGARAVEYYTLAGLASVRVIVRRYGGLARSARFADVDWRVADALDEDQLTKAFEGCDTVLHVVSGSDETIAGSPGPGHRAAVRAGVRKIVFVSSAAVYSGSDVREAHEDLPLDPRRLDGYANAKLAADRGWLKLASAGGPQVVILRPSIIVGPRSFWVAGPAEELLKGRAFLGGGGVGFCNTVYVDDLLDAVLAAMRSDGAAGRIYNIGNGEDWTWRAYYEALAARLGVDPSVIRTGPPGTTGPSRLLTAIRSSRSYQAASLLTPPTFKRLARKLLGKPTVPRSPADVFEEPRPHVIQAIQALHQTPWRLSVRRSEAELGFRCRVTTAAALDRGVAWLKFAGWL